MPGPELKMIATVNVGNEKRYVICRPDSEEKADWRLVSRAKMKKWFEKWGAEKARRKEKGLPAIVEYRDESYVSAIRLMSSFRTMRL